MGFFEAQSFIAIKNYILPVPVTFHPWIVIFILSSCRRIYIYQKNIAKQQRDQG